MNPVETNKTQFKELLGGTGEQFFEICQRPHGSGNEKELADYVQRFAQEQKYSVIRDSHNNIFVQIPASTDCVDKPGIIFQSHLDMVLTPKDMGIVIPEIKIIDNKTIITSKDRKTTLGADNGIMVAFLLNLMSESKKFKHGPIGLLFTTQEETGMIGAKAVNRELFSDIDNYKYLINLDWENEKEVANGSAGYLVSFFDHQPEILTATDNIKYEIEISGLKGGHSGLEIDKEKNNAIKIVGNIVNKLLESEIDLKLVSINGHDLQVNKIADNCTVAIAINIKDRPKFEKLLALEIAALNLPIRYRIVDTNEDINAFKKSDTQKIISFISEIPNGVLKRNAQAPELSSNIGVIETRNNKIYIEVLSRSNNNLYLAILKEELANLATQFGFFTNQSDPVLAWEADPDNPAMKLFPKNYLPRSCHAGLETSIFKVSFPHLKIASVGPKIGNVHTSNEWVDVASINKISKVLINIVKC